MTPLFLAALTLTASAQEKIVNGQEAGSGEFPETVMVSVGGGTCTGSLIHPEWVLTAAHCFDSSDLELDSDAGAIVFFGAGGDLPFTRQVNASLALVHPEYVSLEPSMVSWSEVGQVAPDGDFYALMTHDIALVKLVQPVNDTVMSLNVNPIDDTWLVGDVRVTHIGYGITSFGGTGTGTKRYVDVPMVGYSGEPPEGNWGVSFFDGTGQGRSTCQGDSGGPGVVRVGSGAYFQVGITSYGIACGTGIGTKMRVDPYIDWILGLRDGARDDGVITEAEYIRHEEERVPSVQTGAAGPPRFECSHQLNPESNDSFAIGVVPFDLKCSATIPDFETLEKVTWFWGDGSDSVEVTGADLGQANHEYTEMGVYNVRACFEGMRGEIAYNQCVLKTNHVNACDIPEVEFEIEPLDELQLGLRNLTSLRAHNCITNASWEIFKGSSATGEPIQTLSGWEPIPVLDEPGEYTVLLNVGGLAGTAAAQATIDLKRVGGGCDASSLAPAFGLLGLLPLLGFRRRRD